MKSFLKRLVLWTIVCTLSAIPSLMYAREYSLSGMIAGIGIFIVVLAVITDTPWFDRFRHQPGVQATLLIGYGTRPLMSLLLAPLMFLPTWFTSFYSSFFAILLWPLNLLNLDVLLGLLSIQIITSFYSLFDKVNAEMLIRTFGGTLFITLLQGVLLNLVLFVYMAIVYVVIRTWMYGRQWLKNKE